MFDDIHLHAGPSETRVTKTVHEHRAPTDESVKLLVELTEKARANLVATFATSNNTLQATWANYEDHQSAQRKYFCKFTMNGKDYQLKIDMDELHFQNKHAAVEKLYEKLCAKLAAELMQPLLSEMMKKGAP